jgi:hypothetical protein
MKTKPKLVCRTGTWLVRFGRAEYMLGDFRHACVKARWLWWHQPKVDLE